MVEYVRALVIVAFLASLVMAPGCGETQAQRSMTGGAAIGALAGGLLGGSRGMATGALLGGGLGYVAGNEQDKQLAQAEAARERQALQQARVTGHPTTAYRPPNANPLVGSTWRIISLVTDEPTPEFSSMVITFQTNSKLTTLAVAPDGSVDSYVENYRVVNDVLIISGKDPESGKSYAINAKYSVGDGQMVVVAPDLRAVLEEIDSEV